MMSYSYTAPGASGDHYNILSQDVARTLYFAGEVNNYRPLTIVMIYFLAGNKSVSSTNRDRCFPEWYERSL